MALKGTSIAVVGCGAMGEAMVKGLLGGEFVEPAQITVSHPRRDRCVELEQRYGIRSETDNRAAVRNASLVVIAVKPQYFDEVTQELREAVAPEALVVTIVAGITLQHVEDVLGTPAVVRVMPNTPGQIGRGISVWTASPAVDSVAREQARTLLEALGTEEYVSHESELDMATALSGTGPTYVFLIMEAMIDAGVHMGFSRRRATRLVLETMRGAVEFAGSNAHHPAELRNQVTSPGGTSAAAMYELERGRLRTVLTDAIWAAYRRCVELGKE